MADNNYLFVNCINDIGCCRSDRTNQHKEVEGIKTVQVLSHFDVLDQYPFLNFIDQFVNYSDTLDHLKALLLTQKYSR